MAFRDYPRSAGSVTTIGGAAMTEGTTPRAGVNNALRQLAADGRALADELASIYNGVPLYQYLSPAQEADIAAGTKAIDCSAALQSAVNAAAGRPVLLPEGTIRLDSQVSRITASTSPFTDGLKLIGMGSGRTIIDSRVANNAVFNADTTASFKFQNNLLFKGFTITGQYGVPANATGVRLQRAYNVLFDDVHFNNLSRDGIFVEVGTNDADSSNRIELYRTEFLACKRWGFHHSPYAGQNDLSYLIVHNSRWDQCGTEERKAITGITQANPGVVTSAAHGKVNGDKVRLCGVFGMTEINLQPLTVTVIDANSFSVGIDTTAYTAYSSGGYVYNRKPTSGSIKMNPQMASLRNSFITSSFNVGMFIDGDLIPSFKTLLESFTIENTTGISLLCTGASGLTLDDCDIRANQSYTGGNNYCHVLLDASVGLISEVKLSANSIITFNGADPDVVDCPHSAFEGFGPNLGAVTIEDTTWKAFDTPNLKRYGDNLYFSSALKTRDPITKRLFQSGDSVNTTYATANPTYTPDIRLGQTHIITLAAGASGTLTIAAPFKPNISGVSLTGVPLNIIIVNTSGVTVNLTWGFSTKSAPATINTADTKSGEWTFATTYGWIQSAAWI